MAEAPAGFCLAGPATAPVGVSLVCAITAAGASSRMGRPKALLPWNGRSFLAAMVAAAREAGLDRVLVLSGAHHAAVAAEAARLEVVCVRNPEAWIGRFCTVRLAAGIANAWAAAQDATPALLLWPVDAPAVGPATLARLAREASESPGADVLPVCDGRRGHPVVLGRDTLAHVLTAPLRTNLRELMRRADAAVREVAVDDATVLDNVNTPADYEAFLALHESAVCEGDAR